MNKRATTHDIFFVIVFLFIFAIGFVVAYYTYDTVVDNMQDNPIINASSPTMEVLESGRYVSDKLDYMLFVIFIGLLLGMIISGWFVGAVPLFAFIYFLFIVVSVVLAMVFSYVWDQIGIGVLSSATSQFTIMNHIFNHFGLYIGMTGFIGLIVMFAKAYTGGNQ